MLTFNPSTAQNPTCSAEILMCGYMSALALTLYNDLVRLNELGWSCMMMLHCNWHALKQISQHFEKVVATDVAVEQLKHAAQRPNITYTLTPPTLTKQELARIVGPEGSVDLVIVTEALHWFDLDTFYENVKSVLRKPGGVFAAVAYKLRPQVSEPVNHVLDELYSEMEWSPRVQWVEDEYTTIPFPFTPLMSQQAASTGHDVESKDPFELTMDANLDEFLRYIETWSGTQTAVAKGLDPLNEERRRSFQEAWGSPEIVRRLRWPLVVRVGTVPT